MNPHWTWLPGCEPMPSATEASTIGGVRFVKPARSRQMLGLRGLRPLFSGPSDPPCSLRPWKSRDCLADTWARGPLPPDSARPWPTPRPRPRLGDWHGALAPYNALAAGKLVGALAVSPAVLGAYRAKYSRPSEIASAMAGRPITREARLAFIGTTSLYGTGSSQYNRLFWPASVMGGDDESRMGFYELGRSRSFGTSHFSDTTVDALVRLSEHSGGLVRVNSLFGEGVSPRLRKVRLGLAALGWPSNELLRHGRERILYGVPLVENVRDYSLGIDSHPKYLLDPLPRDDGQAVAVWWFERWGRRRADQGAVREAMRLHRLVRPVRHAARVPALQQDELLPVDTRGNLAGSR